MKKTEWNCIIRWKNEAFENSQECIIATNETELNDDEIFFYVDSEEELRNIILNDTEDFIVISANIGDGGDEDESVDIDEDAEKVVVLYDGGLWSIYNEGGQALEHDFESDDDAIAYANDMGWNVVDYFNV